MNKEETSSCWVVFHIIIRDGSVAQNGTKHDWDDQPGRSAKNRSVTDKIIRVFIVWAVANNNQNRLSFFFIKLSSCFIRLDSCCKADHVPQGLEWKREGSDT